MSTLPHHGNASLALDANVAAGHGTRIALYCGDEQITYGDLLDRVSRMGRVLRRLGVRREERVLLCLDDTPAFPVAFYGAIRVGAVPVPINPLLKADDYRFFVGDTGARVVIADTAHLDRVKEALEGYAGPMTVLVNGEGSLGTRALADMLAAERGDLPAEDTHPDDIAFWLYSGGSTGRPKGVVHLHRDIPYTCNAYARTVLHITADDIVFSRALYHAYGLGNCLTFPFSVGASAVLYPQRPTAAGILAALQRYRPTILGLVPTLYNTIVNDPAAGEYDLSSLRLCISAAEPLPAETWRRWQERFGYPILDGIGSTEMLHVFCSNTLDAVRPGSSGKPVPGYELQLLNEEGRPVEPGTAGDLYVSGASAAPFYWRRREKSVQTFRGEWTCTGDRYRCDEEGFYWYEGRADDMIKVGGEWVSPITVEEALLAHPAVYEVAVVGVVVDGIMRVKAAVVLTGTQQPSAGLIADLQEWCKSRLQRYQYPHFVDFVAELPKTSTGKIQRFVLREQAATVGVPT